MSRKGTLFFSDNKTNIKVCLRIGRFVQLNQLCGCTDVTKEAEHLLRQCLEYPHNLGEGKLHGAQENDFYYLSGCTLGEQKRHDEACIYSGEVTLRFE